MTLLVNNAESTPTTTFAPVANNSTVIDQSGLATLYISLQTIAKIVVPGLKDGYQFPIAVPPSGMKIQFSVGESSNPDLGGSSSKCEFQICRMTAGANSSTLYALDKLGVEIATEPQEFRVIDHILPHPQNRVGQEGKFKEGTQVGYDKEFGVDPKKLFGAKASTSKQRSTEAEATYRRWEIRLTDGVRGSENKPWYNITYDQDCNSSPDKRNLASNLRLELSKPGPDDEHPPHVVISCAPKAELQLQIRALWTCPNIVPSDFLLLKNFEYRVSLTIDLSKIGPGESHATILRIVDQQEFAEERGSIINQSKPLKKKMVVLSSPSITSPPLPRTSSSPGPASLHPSHANSPSMAPSVNSSPADPSPSAPSLSPLPAPTPLPLVSPSSASPPALSVSAKELSDEAK